MNPSRPDDDIRTMVREFRSSVTADLEATGNRIDALADELRERISGVEASFLKELREQGRRQDRQIDNLRSDIADLRRLIEGLSR